MPWGAILLWVAIVSFAAATVGVPAGRLNLVALGLCSLALRMLL